jgi:hypothetical protein
MVNLQSQIVNPAITLDTINASVIVVGNQERHVRAVFVSSVVTGRSPSSGNRELARYARYRGLYARVARRLGVDRSYVSRVARGERRSRRVERALQAD